MRKVLAVSSLTSPSPLRGLLGMARVSLLWSLLSDQVPACVCGHKASLRIINKRGIKPTADEMQTNPRSRSARLRAAERIITQDEHYNIVEQLCSESEVKSNGNGWRNATQLSKLRQAFMAS